MSELERSSLRRHYAVFFTLVVSGLLVTALVSAATVIWASSLVRGESERVVDLHTANSEVLQRVTDSYFSIHKLGTLQPAESTNSYAVVVGHVPRAQADLRELSEGEPRLRKAVERQDEAISAWIDEYAGPLASGDFVPEDPVEFAEEGQRLFEAVRDANQVIDKRIVTLAQESRQYTRTLLIIALSVVTLLPLLAVAGVAYLGRRLSRSVVEPLGDITKVLDQLRSGQEDARALPVGPDEVRQIAAGLNLLTEENLRASEVEADVLNQLQMIDRVRTDLVSTVSHELRTPLASIKGYLELLQDELLEQMTPQQSTMMGAIRRNLDRLNELIANLLALSRAEETELAIQQVDLRGVATEVGADLRLTAAGRDISIRTLHSAGPVMVLGDRSQLIRAVQNLVTNAVKFSRPGGTVELRVTHEGDDAVLEVIDEGIGIPAADLAGLGSRFYRASNAVRAEIAGTGLGLRIVQTILDRHSGQLSVDSVEGEGSTFTVRLPLSRGRLDDFPEVVQDPVLEPELTRD
jgi:signal transduction histidine kinase